MENENDNFAVVPGKRRGEAIVTLYLHLTDANWYMIRPLYLHTVDRLANKFTLAHLKGYNMEDGVPVAPEGRDSNFTLFGGYNEWRYLKPDCYNLLLCL